MFEGERPFIRSLICDLECVLSHRRNEATEDFPTGYLWTNYLRETDLTTLIEQLQGCLTCEEDFEGEADDLALYYMSVAHAQAMTLTE